MMKEKVIIENKEKCWKQKWNRKGTEQKQKMKVSGLIFSWEKCEERKRINKEFQKEFENKRISHTHFFKKKKTREQKKKKRKIAEREKTEDVFSNLLEKNNIFQIHQNRKGINEKLNV